jgi:hypothetical protein
VDDALQLFEVVDVDRDGPQTCTRPVSRRRRATGRVAAAALSYSIRSVDADDPVVSAAHRLVLLANGDRGALVRAWYLLCRGPDGDSSPGGLAGAALRLAIDEAAEGVGGRRASA